ncbi:MAG: hypothetical protein CML45_07780 [Rhodobacteraceae bacterium]|nr:hypothetical protein [Paracoccaceae bacterium]|tara:strand:+ start:8045 stop:9043 length:999 start_codon:yes stop_codon:yes gene_type:complete
MSEDFKYNSPPKNSDKLPRFDPLPTGVEGVLELNPDGFTLAGTNNTKLLEKVPKFNRAECELVFKNHNNAWIVLGRDRPDALDSGKGGAGETKAGAIDICVGRMGFDPDDNATVDNNFKGDAARIYISQRTDVDRNFAMPAGSRGMAEEKSAIAMRADEIRINARNGIKLVTGVYGKLNSSGQREDFTYGIDLIAGGQDNEIFAPFIDPLNPTIDRLQPLVKGTNMVNCVKDLISIVEELHFTVQHWMSFQVKFNTKLMYHNHAGTAGPIPVVTAPDPILAAAALEASLKTIQDGIVQVNSNLSNMIKRVENKYLAPGASGHYICSDHNNTN